MFVKMLMIYVAPISVKHADNHGRSVLRILAEASCIPSTESPCAVDQLTVNLTQKNMQGCNLLTKYPDARCETNPLSLTSSKILCLQQLEMQDSDLDTLES